MRSAPRGVRFPVRNATGRRWQPPLPDLSGIAVVAVLLVFRVPHTFAQNLKPAGSLETGGSAAAAGRSGATLPPATQRAIEALLSNLPQQTTAALVVADAHTGALLFSAGGDRPLRPASLQKLLVTAAALERLGPDFAFVTPAYLNGTELWVIGSGDPGLGDHRLAQRAGKSQDAFFGECAAALRARGVAALTKVVLDDSVFDTQGRHPDWPEAQSDRWYQAPVGGLNLNDNCLDVRVEPRAGAVVLHLQPDLPPELIENRATPGKRQRLILKRLPDRDRFQLAGTVAAAGELEPVAVHDPTMFFAQAMKRALEQRGIVVGGPVVKRAIGVEELRGATLLMSSRTTLRDVLWRCNTFSQNLFAEALLKALAAYGPDGARTTVAGRSEAGAVLVRSTLAALGVDLSGATLRDGSGLSHRNAVSAAQLTQALVTMRRHRHADVFLASLATPGEPGSMQKRYNDPLLRGRLRGKTGTLANVRALAGYLDRPNGDPVAFALLVDGPCNGDLALRVCRTLCE